MPWHFRVFHEFHPTTKISLKNGNHFPMDLCS